MRQNERMSETAEHEMQEPNEPKRTTVHECEMLRAERNDLIERKRIAAATGDSAQYTHYLGRIAEIETRLQSIE